MKRVATLQGGTAPGFDSISADILLKTIMFTVLKPISHSGNFRRLFTTKKLWEIFKLAEVFSLYKSDDFQDKETTCHPISLLKFFLIIGQDSHIRNNLFHTFMKISFFVNMGFKLRKYHRCLV